MIKRQKWIAIMLLPVMSLCIFRTGMADPAMSADLAGYLRSLPGLEDCMVEDLRSDAAAPRVIIKDKDGRLKYTLYFRQTGKSRKEIHFHNADNVLIGKMVNDETAGIIRLYRGDGRFLSSIHFTGKTDGEVFDIEDSSGRTVMRAIGRNGEIDINDGNGELMGVVSSGGGFYPTEETRLAYKKAPQSSDLAFFDFVFNPESIGGSVQEALNFWRATKIPLIGFLAIIGWQVYSFAIALAGWWSEFSQALVAEIQRWIASFEEMKRRLDEEEKKRQAEEESNCETGSFIGINEPVCHVDYTIPAFSVFGDMKSLTFWYISKTANPSVLIGSEVLGMDMTSSVRCSETGSGFADEFCRDVLGPTSSDTAKAEALDWQLDILGAKTRTITFKPPEKDSRLYYHWNGKDAGGAFQPTNVYPYHVRLGIRTDSNIYINTLSNGKVTLINRQDSPFGAGWWLLGLQRIHFSDPSLFPRKLALISDGDGKYVLFEEDSSNPARFKAPAGEYSTLEYDGTNYVRAFKNGTIHVFDQNGFLLREEPVTGAHTRYAYTSAGLLESIAYVNPATGDSISVGFSYDASDKLQKITYPAADGRQVVFTVNQSGDLEAITGISDNITTYVYDDKHNLIEQKKPLDSSRTSDYRYAYGEYGYVERFDGPEGETLLFQPGFKTALVNLMPESHGTPANPAEPVPAENIRDVVVTPSGPISIKIDLKGRPLETTDQLGRRLEYVWANNGNIKAVKQPNKTIIYDYDNVGNRNKIEFKHQETSLTANFEYNSNNQIAQVTDYMDRKTSFEYSPDGTNLTRIISNTNEGLYISYKDTTFPNKITNISNAIGEEYEYSYNNNGDLEQMLDPLGNVLSIEYYDNGNIKAFKDAEDNKIEYAYDNSGFLKEEIIDQSGNRNCYSYDKSGLLRWKLDAKNSQGSCPHWDPEISSDNSESFFYDKSGRLTRTVDRLRNDKEFLYNQSGQISQIKSRDSVYTKFHYDNVGRTTRIECQDLFKNYSYDFDDNRTLLENNDSRVESFYDGFGRPLRHVTIYKWQDKLYPMEFNYQYNSNGKRTYMSNPFTPDTSYSYDDRDRLIRISQGSLIFNYSYDDSGRIDMVIYPNGVIAQREYDGKGRLTDLAYLLNGTLLWATRNIKYDRVNNVTEYTIYRNGLMENKTSYAYDSLYRLIDVAHGETDNRHHEAFSYDIANNLRISPHSTAYAYNVAHQLIEDDNYKYDYDLNGNLIRVNNRTRSEEVLFTYDCFNRLSEVFIFENGNIVSNNIYLYDGDGKKIFAKQNSNKDSNIVGRIYVYDYEDVIAELNKYGVVEATYIHGPGVDEPLAITIAGRTYYYHQDLFGSIVFITDDNGHIINYYNYESFGKLLSVECPSEYIGKPCIANHYTFLSREWDKSIGLYYFKYRWYDPYSYRFTQEDIMKTTNPYVFLDGNPTNWRDPSGLMKEGTKEYKKCYNETKTGWETGLSVAENSPLATDATKNEAKECKIELKEKKNKGNLTESVKILCSKLSQEEYNELKILTENLLKDAMKAKTGIDKFEDQYRKSLEELNNYKQELTDKYDIDLPLPEPCKKCLGIKNPEKESKGE